MPSSLPPLLLVDVGNTSIHWAPYDGEWRASRRLWTRAMSDFGAQLDGAIGIERSQRLPAGWPQVAVVCSVVPETAAHLTAELEGRNMEVLVLGDNLQAPMPIRYYDPEQLGQDRLANAAGAFDTIRGAVIVADIGTAITVDAVSGDGEFLGGAIAPGPHRAWQGFLAGVHGSGFAEIDTGWPEHQPRGGLKPIGRSTQECVEAGVRLGFAGLADRLVRDQRAVLGPDTPVLWTGGAAPLLRPHSEDPGEFDDLLTLRGLVAIYRATTT